MKSKITKKVKITITLSDALYRQVKSEAKRLKISINEFIVIAIQSYLKNQS